MSPFDDGEPADTREAIMRATYRALREHGYAALTIQRIGDEFEKSKSLLYHHYDGKDELLLEFLEFMLEEFDADVESGTCEDAPACLDRHLDRLLDPDPSEERLAFERAMAELRAQAAHDPAYREHFTRSDRVIRDRLADVIERGIEAGDFREVDPGTVAEHLHTLLLGAMVGRATADGRDVGATREEVDAYLDARLRGGE